MSVLPRIVAVQPAPAGQAGERIPVSTRSYRDSAFSGGTEDRVNSDRKFDRSFGAEDGKLYPSVAANL